MALTLADLRQFVEDYDTLNDETEVVFAGQPAWPMEYSISSDVTPVYDEDTAEWKIYLNESNSNGYLPENAAREIGWR